MGIPQEVFRRIPPSDENLRERVSTLLSQRRIVTFQTFETGGSMDSSIQSRERNAKR